MKLLQDRKPLYPAQLLKNDTFRWSSSFILVASLHLSAALYAMKQEDAGSPSESTPIAAIMIDLAPSPVAPPPIHNTLEPVQPEPEQPKTGQKEPEHKVLEPPTSKLAPAPKTIPPLPVVKKAEAVIQPSPISPKKEKPAEQKLEPVKTEVPVKQERVRQAIDAPEALTAAAPKDGASSQTKKRLRATWQSALFNHLAQHKRYPRLAKRNREEAIVLVRIIISRNGLVINSHLEKPSEFSALNKETLALIARAQPLPIPPPEVEGKTIELIVPVEFALRR